MASEKIPVSGMQKSAVSNMQRYPVSGMQKSAVSNMQKYPVSGMQKRAVLNTQNDTPVDAGSDMMDSNHGSISESDAMGYVSPDQKTIWGTPESRKKARAKIFTPQQRFDASADHKQSVSDAAPVGQKKDPGYELMFGKGRLGAPSDNKLDMQALFGGRNPNMTGLFNQDAQLFNAQMSALNRGESIEPTGGQAEPSMVDQLQQERQLILGRLGKTGQQGLMNGTDLFGNLNSLMQNKSDRDRLAQIDSSILGYSKLDTDLQASLATLFSGQQVASAKNQMDMQKSTMANQATVDAAKIRAGGKDSSGTLANDRHKTLMDGYARLKAINPQLTWKEFLADVGEDPTSFMMPGSAKAIDDDLLGGRK